MRDKLTISKKAKYIWRSENQAPDDYVIFRKSFSVNEIPLYATAYISVDTKYWLYINGKQIVFEGGLFRESLPFCGYADCIDIAPFLKHGDNKIAILAHYYGNQGRNNVDSGQAGLLFSCDSINVYSDSSFICKKHSGYYHVDGSKSSFLYGGYDLGVKGESEDHNFYLTDISDKDYEKATEYENTVWGDVYLRPIPQIKLYETKLLDYKKAGNELVIKLPAAMTFSPFFKLKANGGEKLVIKSDRYEVSGGPGDQHHTYRGQLIEYICKKGLNEFQSITYLYGEEFYIVYPDEACEGIEFIEVGAAESLFDTVQTGKFTCSCQLTNKLIEKSIRTLAVCMRDNFMDCPDRERGQWIGDVSVQVPQALMIFDDNAAKLVKKTILDFIYLRKGDVLVGNVPGVNYSELPGQSLNAISEVGIIAEYFKYTGDKSVLEVSFEPSIRYLMLWEIDDEGLLKPRKGNWRWFDHLYNVDDAVIENAFYYSALKFARKVSEIIGNNKYSDFLNLRIEKIRDAFEKKFWNGRFFTSGNIADDRANAIAVLAGLVDKKHYNRIRVLLLSVFNSSVYMENYVLWALCKMGYIKDAYKRMASRYYNLAVNENSTLWEDFYILGSKNHAWSGAPLSIAFKYFAGIDTDDGFEHYTVNPVTDLFSDMAFSFKAKDKTVSVTVDGENVSISESVTNNKR